MGDPSMALGAEDVRRIVDFAKPWLRDAILDLVPRGVREIDTQLLERIVRVEEELKAQRELMAARFDANDRRFEGLQASIATRFEDQQTSIVTRFEDQQTSMAARFEDQQTSMAARFDASDKRFAALQWTMLVGFTIVTAAVTFFALFV